MTEQTDLPTVLTHTSLIEWLDHLLDLPPIHAAKKMLEALNQLKNVVQHDSGSVMLPRLIELIPLTLRLTSTLNRGLSHDTNPSIEKNAKITRLCLQLPRQLALIFAQAADNDDLNDIELLSAIYHALQLTGYCLRHYALHYEVPSNSLWKKTVLVYKLALARHLLQVPFYTTIAEFKAQNTIENVLKRNLLFSLSTPTLYSKEEITLHFELAEQLASDLDMASPHQPGRFGFCWDLNSDDPPGPIKFIRKQLPPGHLNLETQAAGQKLEKNALNTRLTPMCQQRLALQLTGYTEIFESILPGTPLRSHLVLGFSNVCSFLKEQNKFSKIQQLSTGLPQNNHRRNMTLLPLDHERNAFDTANTSFDATHHLARTVNIIKTPHQQFIILQGSSYDCETGDLCILFKETDFSTLAIIRRQKEHDISGSIHILLEKINGHYTVYRYHTEQGIRQAIIVEGQPSEVFLLPGKYTLNNRIILAAGISIKLTGFMESNNFFARFRFNFDS